MLQYTLLPDYLCFGNLFEEVLCCCAFSCAHSPGGLRTSFAVGFLNISSSFDVSNKLVMLKKFVGITMKKLHITCCMLTTNTDSDTLGQRVRHVNSA